MDDFNDNAVKQRQVHANVNSQDGATGAQVQQTRPEMAHNLIGGLDDDSSTTSFRAETHQQRNNTNTNIETEQHQNKADLERLRARMNNSVHDFVMWRDVKQSGVVFAVGFALLLAITYMPLTQLLLLIGQIGALGLVGINLMVKLSNSKFRHPLANVIHSETTINPEPVHRVVDGVLRVANAQLAGLKRVVLAGDIATPLKVAATCYALSYVASWFSALTLVFLFWIGLFTLPKVYTINKQPIDRNVGMLRNKIGQVEEMLVEKVPALRPILTGNGIFAIGTRTEQSSMTTGSNVSNNNRGGRGQQQQTTTTTTTASTTVRNSGGGGNNRNR